MVPLLITYYTSDQGSRNCLLGQNIPSAIDCALNIDGDHLAVQMGQHLCMNNKIRQQLRGLRLSMSPIAGSQLLLLLLHQRIG